jgi:pimeloyl-ACP methyl ester carboxylesterase
MPQVNGTIDFQGVKICYTKAGSGPPVVLIHGWSFNYEGWQPLIDALAPTHTVIAYDWFGMGCSEGGDRSYPFQRVVDLLDFIIRELCDGKKPIIIGHSVGSCTTLQYSVEWSDRIVASMCVDCALPLLRQVLFSALFTVWAGLFGIKSIEGFVAFLFFSRKWRKNYPDLLDKWKRQWETNRYRQLVSGTWMWSLRPNLKRQLDRIKVPLSVVNGSLDLASPLWAAKRLHKLIPGSQLAVVEGAGHISYVEQPQTFNEIVLKFLAGLP